MRTMSSIQKYARSKASATSSPNSAKEKRSENLPKTDRKTLGRLRRGQAEDWFRRFLAAFRAIAEPVQPALIWLTTALRIPQGSFFQEREGYRRQTFLHDYEGHQSFIEAMRPMIELAGATTQPTHDQTYRLAEVIGWIDWLRQVSHILDQLALTRDLKEIVVPAAEAVLKRGESSYGADQNPSTSCRSVLNVQLRESLRHIDWGKIRICEICNNVFLGAQLRSSTCSDECNNRLRQRRSYHRIKAAGEMAMEEKKDLFKIARQLGVEQEQARRYLTKYRKQSQK
jgi:hypothetical protein